MIVVVSGALIVACGSGDSTAATGSGQGDSQGSRTTLGCDDGVAPIRELLRTGIPTYDYDPFTDLPELIAASDEIVSGTLLTAQRVEVEESEDPDGRDMIVVQPAEAMALQPDSSFNFEPFTYDAVWAQRDQPDPLADPVSFDPARVRFIAFLWQTDAGLIPHIQGLALSCDRDLAAVSVLDPPPGTEGMTIDEIEAAVLDVTDPPPPTANVITVPHRLLVEDLDYGDAYTTTRLTAEQVWEVAPDAEVDVDNEVFLEFNLVESSTCPNGPLDRIEFNPDTARLYPVLEDDEHESDCTDDDTPHVIIVAITRQDLPAVAFTATTGATDNIGGLDDGYASFGPGELRAPSQDSLEHPVLRESSPLAVGETGVILDAYTHCGFERLFYPVDGRQWLLTDVSAAVGVPTSWDEVTRGESIDLVVERVAAGRLVVTARGTTDSVEYRPADDEEGCG